MIKRIAGYLLAAAGVLAGCARWLDLTNFTDPHTEFVTVGSVWMRYGVLAALVVIAALASLMACRSDPLRRRSGLRSVLAFAVCAAFAAMGSLQLVRGMSSSVLSAANAALALATAWWAAVLGLAWRSEESERPAGGVLGGVLGTLLFYGMTLQRFVRNSSSFYRVSPTVGVFSALAALLFASALIRAVYAPKNSGRKLVFSGFTAFYLCTCIELPQAVCRWLAGITTTASLVESMTLAVFGLLGAACALAALREDPESPDNGAAILAPAQKDTPEDCAKCTRE